MVERTTVAVHKILSLQESIQVTPTWTPTNQRDHREGLGDSYLRFYVFRIIMRAMMLKFNTENICDVIDILTVNWLVTQLQVPQSPHTDPILRFTDDVTPNVERIDQNINTVLQGLIKRANTGILFGTCRTFASTTTPPHPPHPLGSNLVHKNRRDVNRGTLKEEEEQEARDVKTQEQVAPPPPPPPPLTKQKKTNNNNNNNNNNTQLEFTFEMNRIFNFTSFEEFEEILGQSRNQILEEFRCLANRSGRIHSWRVNHPSSKSFHSVFNGGSSSIKTRRRTILQHASDPLYFLCLTTTGCSLPTKVSGQPPSHLLPIPILKSCLTRACTHWGYWWSKHPSQRIFFFLLLFLFVVSLFLFLLCFCFCTNYTVYLIFMLGGLGKN